MEAQPLSRTLYAALFSAMLVVTASGQTNTSTVIDLHKRPEALTNLQGCVYSGQMAVQALARSTQAIVEVKSPQLVWLDTNKSISTGNRDEDDNIRMRVFMLQKMAADLAAIDATNGSAKLPGPKR